MKRLATGFAILFCCHLLTVSALALTYTDDFNDSTSNNIKAYTNLSHMELSSYGNLPDRTAFSFASTASPMGWAIYRVQNAQTVTVGLYTLSGSFYMRNDNTGDWYLGLGDSISAIQGKAFPQASYSPSTGAVYAVINNTPHMAHEDDAGNKIFDPVDALPGALIGYGVNVYASSNGQAWTQVSLMQTEVSYVYGAPFFYEELSGSVPGWATYIKVELNDYTRLPVLGASGQYVSKASSRFNSLASVSLAGTDLILGLPEPEVPEPVERDEEEEPSRASSKSASSRASTTKAAATAASKTSAASKYSGAKFEGVIEASTASKRSAAASSKAASAPSAKASAEPEPAPDASAEEVYRYAQVDAVYQIPSKNNDDITFTVGITAYIIIMTALIAFVVIKSIGKRQ